MNRSAIFLVSMVLLGAGRNGILDFDFRNAEYPMENDQAVPMTWKWLPRVPDFYVRLRDGRAEVDRMAPGASVQLLAVAFGDLDGDREDEAVVDLLYRTGGTANWHYVYAFKRAHGRVVPIGVLKSGSRSNGGLVALRIDKGLLVLDFMDAQKSQGECCSNGAIRVAYSLQHSRFDESGPRQHFELKQNDHTPK